MARSTPPLPLRIVLLLPLAPFAMGSFCTPEGNPLLGECDRETNAPVITHCGTSDVYIAEDVKTFPMPDVRNVVGWTDNCPDGVILEQEPTVGKRIDPEGEDEVEATVFVRDAAGNENDCVVVIRVHYVGEPAACEGTWVVTCQQQGGHIYMVTPPDPHQGGIDCATDLAAIRKYCKDGEAALGCNCEE